MSYESDIYEAAANYLRKEWGLPVIEVLNIDTDIEYQGGCETCSYEEIVVKIHYVNALRETVTYTYYGTFGEFITALDKATED